MLMKLLKVFFITDNQYFQDVTFVFDILVLFLTRLINSPQKLVCYTIFQKLGSLILIILCIVARHIFLLKNRAWRLGKIAKILLLTAYLVTLYNRHLDLCLCFALIVNGNDIVTTLTSLPFFLQWIG